MPAILVIRFGAEGGDLELLFPFDHDHHPELAPDGNGVLEELLDLLRQGGGGDVVIARLAAQQEIAHAAAHPEGGEPGALQPADDGVARVRGSVRGCSRHLRFTIYDLRPTNAIAASFADRKFTRPKSA